MRCAVVLRAVVVRRPNGTGGGYLSGPRSVANPGDWPATGTTSTLQAMAEDAPGRSCPTSYLSRPEDLGEPASRSAEVLYVVGGLYGSVATLEAVLARAALEDAPVLIVFNGDFHYLDVAVDDFRAVAEGVAHTWLRAGTWRLNSAASTRTAGADAATQTTSVTRRSAIRTQ